MKIIVKIKPNNTFDEIKELGKNNYEIKLKAPAKDNKANLLLLKRLKKYFKAKEVKIKSGLNSKKKIIEIE